MTTDLILQILFGALAIFVVVFIILLIQFMGTISRVNRTIDDLNPTIKKVNKTIDSIQPAIQRVDPLLERVSLTVDAVNLEIMRADQILADISEVTDVASSAVIKVAEITDAPLNLLNSASDKIRSVFGGKRTDKKAEETLAKMHVNEQSELFQVDDQLDESIEDTAEASIAPVVEEVFQAQDVAYTAPTVDAAPTEELPIIDEVVPPPYASVVAAPEAPPAVVESPVPAPVIATAPEAAPEAPVVVEPPKPLQAPVVVAPPEAPVVAAVAVTETVSATSVTRMGVAVTDFEPELEPDEGSEPVVSDQAVSAQTGETSADSGGYYLYYTFDDLKEETPSA